MNKNNFIISSGIGLFAVIMVFSIFSFDKSAGNGYNFSEPSAQMDLPDTLREISGIAFIDESTLACVQDENGILFLYDLNENGIVTQQPFNFDGDYEGVARVGSTMYVLRSDGWVFEIRKYASDSPKVDSIETHIPVDNSEGLCYDSDNNRLLIACKNKMKNVAEKKNTRFIYALDLKTKTCSDQPVITIDLNDLKTFAKEKNVQFPVRVKKHDNGNPVTGEPVLKFRPSEIAIHPVSRKLFMLSAVDHALFIFSPEGKLQHIEVLDPELFNKAEGIAFLDNGDLLISNEGQSKKPTLLRFNYQAK
jgi:uncharacterized protein YjiK